MPLPEPRDEPEPERYVLTIEGDAERRVRSRETLELAVTLTSDRTDAGVAEELIRFTILEQPEGSGSGESASLTAARAMTDDAGVARNTLQASAAPGRVVVQAAHERAGSVEFVIDVEPLPTGDLVVRVRNVRPDIMALHSIALRLYPVEDMSCQGFLPLGAQAAPLAAGELPSPAEQQRFEGLDALRAYTVTAIAYGNRDQIAAGSCLDAIALEDGGVREIVLDLDLLPLLPTGRYEVTSYWDMSQAVAQSGPMGSLLVSLFDYFEDPGRALYNEAIRLIYDFFGPEAAGYVDTFMWVTGYDRDLQDMINDAIDNNQILSRIRQVGNDLRETVSAMEVDSILTIGKMDGDAGLIGRDEWYGITLYWRANCDASSPPDCGRHRIGVGADSIVGIAGADWVGRVHGHDRLEIDSHVMNLRYGRIIIEVLNQILLPAMTDGQAHSLDEAFSHWLGCGRIAQSIGDICAAGLCITTHTIEQVCEVAVTAVFAGVELYVSNLDTPMEFHIGGTGRLFEIDSDGFVDLIEEGVFTGHIRTNGQNAPVDALWSGVRLPDGP